MKCVDDSAPRPVIAGTRIKVSQIAYEFEFHRMSADEIVESHPHLTLAQVHAALAYYYDHQEAIHRDWREADALIEATQAQFPTRSHR